MTGSKASLPSLGEVSAAAHLRVAARAMPPTPAALGPINRLDQLLTAIATAHANNDPAAMVAYIDEQGKGVNLASRLPQNWKVVADNTALASGAFGLRKTTTSRSTSFAAAVAGARFATNFTDPVGRGRACPARACLSRWPSPFQCRE